MGVEDTEKLLLCGLLKMKKETKKIKERKVTKEKVVKVEPVEEVNNKKKIEKIVSEDNHKNIENVAESQNGAVSLEEALKKLRSFEKKKFIQTIDLIINLQKFDSRKESLNSFVQVPHQYERDIAAFLSTKVKGVDVILKDSFESYKNLRDTKRLAKKYDMFISAAPLMGQVATKFGRALGPSGKMPSPQLGIVVKEDEETIKKLIEKMKKSIRVRTKEKVIKVGVGKEDMSDKEILENLDSAIKGISDLLPQKKDNIKNILIKFTMTPAVKIIYGN
jgi:large subunit ribosomal protein L1